MISSIEGIYVILLWIIPGFFGYTLFRFVSVSATKHSEFDKTIFSLLYSFTSYVILFQFTGPLSFEQLVLKLFDPVFLRNSWFLPAILGIIAGAPARLTSQKRTLPGDCWILFQHKLRDKKPGVTVYTKDGKEIEGILNYAGKEEVDKEIIITNPKMIIRDKKHEPISEMSLGNEMLFTKDDIIRIAFWEHF